MIGKGSKRKAASGKQNRPDHILFAVEELSLAARQLLEEPTKATFARSQRIKERRKKKTTKSHPLTPKEKKSLYDIAHAYPYDDALETRLRKAATAGGMACRCDLHSSCRSIQFTQTC